MNGRRGKELLRAKAGLTGGKKAGPQQTGGRERPRPHAQQAWPERPSGSPGRCGRGSSSRMASLPRVLGLAFRREPRELASQCRSVGLGCSVV